MRKITTSTDYSNYYLSTAKNDEGYYVEILNSIDLLFKYMTEKHNNVFVVNSVVKFPQNFNIPNNNRLFLNFLESFSLHCRRRKYDPKYLWVRERSLRTSRFHYHVIYLFNSNYIQNAHGIHEKALKLWAKHLNMPDAAGLIELCKFDEGQYYYGGIKLRKNSPYYAQIYSLILHRASYLAKVYSKGYSSAYVNQFGMSRLY